MARYCFYCGRELGDHEKCDCRSRAYVAGERRQAHSPPPKSPGSDKSKQSRDHSTNPSQNWKHQAEAPPPQGRTQRVRRQRPVRQKASAQDRARTIQSFLQFFAAPAQAMAGDLSTRWTPSHSLWFSISLALSGFVYSLANRYLTGLSGAVTGDRSLGMALLSWLTGSAFVALILLLFTLTLWLLARFLYRQGGLPFLHALTVAKSAWKYLSLFLALALPSLFTGGAAYGLILALMGLVFAVIIHARQLAALTYLDENRTWQLTYLSLVVFAGILSSVTVLARMLDLVS